MRSVRLPVRFLLGGYTSFRIKPRTEEVSIAIGCDLERLAERYTEHAGYANPAAVIDCNHDNSGKRPLEQYRICKEVLDSCRRNESISKLVKGFMIESYLEDGNQPVDGGVFGKSITDPCLGWEKTDYLIHEIAERI